MRAHLIWAAASIVSLACLAACSGRSGGDPVDYRIISHAFERGLADIATGDFEQPAHAYASIPVDERYSHVLNFQVTPMLPPRLDPIRGQGPLVIYSDDLDVIVFSPMDHFFESLVWFEDGALRSGLQGEIEAVPAGFEHRFLVVEGHGINATLERWGQIMRADRGRDRVDRYADVGLSSLGYWTDNGAYYYYRTEEGLDEEDTLLAVKADADARGIPYGYFQLDSWWYFKVPGGSPLSPWKGLVRWEPQPQMFPEGLAAFRQRLGLPLILHNRWLAPENDYLDLCEFDVEGDFALPRDGSVFERFMADAVSWGVVTYEQDWLANQFWGLSVLRRQAGRAEAWMEQLTSAAAGAGLTVQLCMASPAHLLDTLDRPAVTSVRTSIDYAAGISKESYWPQFHTVNMVAWAIGILPFKDNFHASEAHGQAEALISTLSAGMVGPGDRVGLADPGLVLATCRSDGRLLKPDRPATPLDAMFLPHRRPFTVSTWSERQDLGRWTYLAAFHLAAEHPERSAEDELWPILQYEDVALNQMFVFPDEVSDWRVDLEAELGIGDEVVAYDWRTGRAELVDGALELPVREHLYDFDYLVLAPVFPSGLALIGEPAKFVTLADARFSAVRVDGAAIEVELTGAPAERVQLLAFDTRTGELLDPVAVDLDEQGLGAARIER